MKIQRFARICGFALGAVLCFVPEILWAAETAANVMSASDRSLLGLAAMGAVGISCIASGLALGKIGSAALGAMSEKPELGGRALIFLGMAEGIAIYGLIIAIMILNKI